MFYKSIHLCLGSHLKEWYQDATSVPYGHLHIDLTPKTVNSLRYCSNKGLVPTKFYLPAGLETKFLDDEYIKRRYLLNISKKFSKTSKTINSHLSRDFTQLLSECLVNLLRGELRDLRRKDVVKYQKEHKRRIILSSTKGIQLISIINPFDIKRLT